MFSVFREGHCTIVYFPLQLTWGSLGEQRKGDVLALFRSVPDRKNNHKQCYINYINLVDVVNWPTRRVFEADVSSDNTRSVSFRNSLRWPIYIYLSTQLIKQNHLVVPPTTHEYNFVRNVLLLHFQNCSLTRRILHRAKLTQFQSVPNA